MSSPHNPFRVSALLLSLPLFGFPAVAQQPAPPAVNPAARGAAYILLKVNNGTSAFDKGDYDQAIADLSDALRVQPANPRALLYRGKAYYFKNDWDRAIANLTALLQADPENAAAFYVRGASYAEKAVVANNDIKLYDLALADLTKALELDPNAPDSYVSLITCGNIYRFKKDYERSLGSYNRAIKLDDKKSEAYCARGKMYSQQEDYDKAVRDYTTAIEKAPRDANILNLRGNCYVEKNQIDLAIADYDRAIELLPGEGRFYSNRGLAYTWKDDYAGALRDLDRGLELSPRDAYALGTRSLVQLTLKAYDEAIADATQALRIDPKNVYSLVIRGDAYQKVKAYDRALTNYEAALKLDPENPLAHASCAWLWATCSDAHLRDGKKALEYATKAYELTKNKSETCPLETLAAAYAENGRMDDAVKWQKKSLERMKASTPWLEESRQRLHLYEEKKPYRE